MRIQNEVLQYGLDFNQCEAVSLDIKGINGLTNHKMGARGQ